jgi:lipopolysaccharide/colanic/teichoic acid biosynthesis glycosyltransferase
VKKILYSVTSPVSAVAFMRGQIQYSQQQNLEVHLITANEPELEVIAKRETVVLHPITMQREISFKTDFFSLWQMIRQFWKIRPDVSNVSTPKAGLLGGVAALLTRVPARVYTLRGLRLETATGAKRVVLTLTEWIACATAHKIVCVSPSLRSRVLALGLATPEKTIVLAGGSSNGVIADRFTPTPKRFEAAMTMREELGIPQDSPVIGFVGRFTRDKGYPELIDAFEQIVQVQPTTYLLLVGDYEDGDPISMSYRKKLESLPNVIQVGFVADPAPMYQVLDVLVLPTHREGFPNVPLEAAAAGKPVITTNATGAVDSVVDSVTGLIVPVGDATALAHAISKLLENPRLAVEMGKAGKARVETDFQPERIWQELHQLYTVLYRERMQIRRQRSAWVKRTFDIVASFLGLLFLAPILIVVAWLVRQKLGTPVLFAQKRPGLNGKPFQMYKFRTMTDARDNNGNLLPDADRLTTFGKWLRATSLDELPGLWNVLRGDMSLVGPRPLLIEYLERYTPEQARRHEVKPGITGWAQVNGRNAISWEEKFKLDVWYVENHNLLLDLRILILTLAKLYRRDNISASGHVTMPEFLGQHQTQGARSEKN